MQMSRLLSVLDQQSRQTGCDLTSMGFDRGNLVLRGDGCLLDSAVDLGQQIEFVTSMPYWENACSNIKGSSSDSDVRC